MSVIYDLDISPCEFGLWNQICDSSEAEPDPDLGQERQRLRRVVEVGRGVVVIVAQKRLRSDGRRRRSERAEIINSMRE